MNFNRPNLLSSLPTIVFNLIIINTILWITSTLIFPKFGIDLTNLLGMHFWVDDSFNPIQLVTYIFMHSTLSPSHLFFNMFSLYMFGSDIERIWGWKKFSLFYIFTGIGAGIIQQLTWMIDFQPYLSAFNAAINQGSFDALSQMLGTDMSNVAITDIVNLKNSYFRNVITVGASGSIFGLLLAYAWLFPDRKIMLIFLPVPISSRVFIAIYAVIELLLGVSNFSIDNIAHFAHLGGMIFGAIILLYWKKIGKLYTKN